MFITQVLCFVASLALIVLCAMFGFAHAWAAFEEAMFLHLANKMAKEALKYLKDNP